MPSMSSSNIHVEQYNDRIQPHAHALDWDDEEGETQVFETTRGSPRSRATVEAGSSTTTSADATPLDPAPAPGGQFLGFDPSAGPVATFPPVLQDVMPSLRPAGMYIPAAAYAPAPEVARTAAPTRSRFVPVLIAIALLAGAGLYWFYPRSGVLQLSVEPATATVSLDGKPVAGQGTFLIEERAGVHRLTVSGVGYTAFDREIQISAKQRGRMNVSLKVSPNTGFEIASVPSGLKVWLDGQPLVVDKSGQQAVTDVRAPSIVPGRHVIEIRDDPRYQPWREEFLQEPGRMLQLRADLKPVVPDLSAAAGTHVAHSARHEDSASPHKAREQHAAADTDESGSSDSADAVGETGSSVTTREPTSSATSASASSSGSSSSAAAGTDPFEQGTWRRPSKPATSRPSSDEDIFETYGAK
jgi:hypothetical protein